MAKCKVDPGCSRQLQTLIATWKNGGYPSVEIDLENAYKEIRKDIQACRCRKAARFSAVLGEFELLKYRQKNSQAKEGASGGWRFYAVYDKSSATLYPIIVYPKKEWTEASDAVITGAISELRSFLKSPVLWAQDQEPVERFKHQNEPDGRIRSLCFECGATVVVSFSEQHIAESEARHECQDTWR